MTMIDYRNAKVIWDNSFNWVRPDEEYGSNQDILQLVYENCVIDVGRYPGNRTSSYQFAIMVIDYTDYANKVEAWSTPYAIIPCASKQDLISQLQRAVDIYPNLING